MLFKLREVSFERVFKESEGKRTGSVMHSLPPFYSCITAWNAISSQIWKLLEPHNSSQHESSIWFCQSDATKITSIKTFRSPLFCCYLIAQELSVSYQEWLWLSQTAVLKKIKEPTTTLSCNCSAGEKGTNCRSINLELFDNVSAPCLPRHEGFTVFIQRELLQKIQLFFVQVGCIVTNTSLNLFEW